MGVPRVAVEASHPDGWRKYVGLDGLSLGVATFGESAPGADVYRHFGLTADAVAAAVRAWLDGAAGRAGARRVAPGIPPRAPGRGSGG